MGDDDGSVGTAARELGVAHVPTIEKNEFGTPLLSSAFCCARRLAHESILVYANADVIFFQDLMEAVQRVQVPSFLMCGRRWDLEVTTEIDFADDAWASSLHRRIGNEGTRHSLSGMDYFIFPQDLVDMPPFAVGRPGWDSWLIYHVRSRGIPVIDATEAVTVVHQNHDYSHSVFGEKRRIGGPELRKNIEVAGGLVNMLTLRDADWVLSKEGLKRPGFPRRLFPLLSLHYPWRALLAAKRRLQEYVS